MWNVCKTHRLPSSVYVTHADGSTSAAVRENVFISSPVIDGRLLLLMCRRRQRTQSYVNVKKSRLVLQKLNDAQWNNSAELS